ncbi:MAG: acetyl-CoA hydrolase/transferase C-terminal domain-containing protein [Desulfobacterales bacterium]|nr:acetyl-CoA hydrolase/transferase C-terminal domain-containing protein [Desulfobacterales bacterium]
MTTEIPKIFTDVEACIDGIIQKVGKRIIMALPLGLGKACRVTNALYQRVAGDPDLHLTIVTALALSRPAANSDLEKRFMDPLMDRVFGDYPELAYLEPLRTHSLPANVEIVEFFLTTGKSLNNPVEQQNYISSNYTHVVRDLLAMGVNVCAQIVSQEKIDGKTWYSLSCNPDLTPDLVPQMRAAEQQGRPVAVVAEINANLPFMVNDAMVDPADFDMVVDTPACTYTLPAPPNAAVGQADHMIGLLASTLTRDGGTLQIGIGSLGDAIASALRLRHQDNGAYRQALAALEVEAKFGDAIAAMGGLDPFDQGLYGSSEMFINGFLELYQCGVLKREVYPDETIQRLVNEGRITPQVDSRTLEVLLDDSAVSPLLSERDVKWLRNFGIFKAGVAYEDGTLRVGPDLRIDADLNQEDAMDAVCRHCLGDRLQGGIVMHGGFFLGPRKFYEALSNMDKEERKKFCMTSVMFVNQLYANPTLATLQRTDARFFNTCMMATLTGAACSDGLEDGRVVSGVGGQYNFVAMAHELPGARSILMLRSTRSKQGKTSSNILGRYGHITIPRHLRDVVITEYGIADLRGRTDQEVIAALINIADSQFQENLVHAAQKNGKLSRDYQIPEAFRNNRPERLKEKLAAINAREIFPAFPFGTDMTDTELALGKALQGLKSKLGSPGGAAKAAARALDVRAVPEAAEPYLERMGLAAPGSLKEKMVSKMIVAELIAGGFV